MDHKQAISTRCLVATGLMAALTIIGSGFRITLPLDIAGTTSFHLGNIMCALSGILLGPWLGALAAGLGSALYDVTNPLYISECWITFLSKGAYGLTVGLVILAGRKRTEENSPLTAKRICLATAAGAILYAIVYLAKSVFYSSMLIKGLPLDAALLAVTAKLPATIFNAVVAIVLTPILAIAIRKALEQNHLSLDPV